MMLYHGTNADIKTINLGMCRPYKDFGTGFYLASIKEQAIKMAVRISKIHGGKPIVNIYIKLQMILWQMSDCRLKILGQKRQRNGRILL